MLTPMRNEVKSRTSQQGPSFCFSWLQVQGEIPPEKAMCPSRCFQLSCPIAGQWSSEQARVHQGTFHSTVNLCVVPDDDLISSHSPRNLEFTPLNYVFSMSKPSGDLQPQFILKSLSSVPGLTRKIWVSASPTLVLSSRWTHREEITVTVPSCISRKMGKRLKMTSVGN